MAEFAEYFSGQRLGNFACAGVVAWLATAGLRDREGHGAARIFQQLQRGKTNIGSDEIYETGDKQADVHDAI